MKKTLLAGCAALALCTGAAAQGVAAPGVEDAARARLALAAGWAQDDGVRIAGLMITLAPGWKTYWRAPGEAGLAAVFDWEGSGNVASVAVEWPAPTVFETYGMTSFGYEGHTVLPLVVTPLDPLAPITLRLALDFGVCADICVPEHATLALDIAPGAAPHEAGPIAQARSEGPMNAAQGGVLSAACGLRGAGVTRDFAARLDLAAAPDPATVVVVEGPEGVWFSTAQTAVEGRTLSVAAQAQVYGGPGWIDRSALRMTLLAPGRAVDVQGCAALPG